MLCRIRKVIWKQLANNKANSYLKSITSPLRMANFKIDLATQAWAFLYNLIDVDDVFDVFLNTITYLFDMNCQLITVKSNNKQKLKALKNVVNAWL